MRKVKLAGASIIAAVLAALLLPAPAASANEVDCNNSSFVHVYWHPGAMTLSPNETCFANAGKNWFAGWSGSSSWMDTLSTGNNDITFVDCNGTKVDFPRWTDWSFQPSWCVAWINIKPY